MASSDGDSPIDWSKCVLCQKDDEKQKMQNPCDSKRFKGDYGYKTFAGNIKEFQE